VVASSAVQAAALRDKHKTDELIVETLHHQGLCHSKTKQFQGRQEQLRGVGEYLASDGGEGGKQPLVLHGESGCGKTSIMAKAARELVDLYYTSLSAPAEAKEEIEPQAQAQAQAQPRVVIRLLGTTASSADAPALVRNLCLVGFASTRGHTHTHTHTHTRARART
jgi:predicted ATPase